MAATTHSSDPVVDDDPDAHPNRELLYVKIAVVLAVLTGIEVMTYATPNLFGGQGPIMTGILLLLMAVKFWFVAGTFMHLKFDKKVLTVVFYSGLALAVAVYIAVLTAFRFWGPADDQMIRR